VRFRPVVAFLLAALAAVPLVGCSRKAETLVGAGRVIRGPGGLGTTVQLVSVADRDTYVEPATADFDSLLLVGQSGAFQARTYLAVKSWNLPDTTLAGLVIQTISLELPRNLTLGLDTIQINLSLTATAWDTTTVAWPGPATGAQLGSARDPRTTQVFSLPLTSLTFTQIKQWALAPASVPGFVLDSPSLTLLAAYIAGGVKFRISYTHTATGSVLQSVDTPVTQDFYLRPPLTPAPTGADTALVLGGLYKTSLAIHVPVDSIPKPVSVDEAMLVLRLVPGSAIPDPADVAGVLQVRPIANTWTDAVTQQTALTVAPASFASGRLATLYSSSDRTFSIRLPGSLMRAWASSPSTNQGLLITLVNRQNLTKHFEVGSLESSRPTELHVSFTELPPGRF
jgi:hypothetical protein